ncbi:MAG: DUF4212 domain-containing protein [bacterium]|nr:DUF4212 domain-containing protein [bacterium]
MNDEFSNHAETTATTAEANTRNEIHEVLDRYWKANLKVMAILLSVWALAGLGCGVLLAGVLNRFHFLHTGYPLGFWFAHQGAILVFVALILVYCVWMNILDARHHAELEAIKRKGDR